jgi:hypothetical protein
MSQTEELRLTHHAMLAAWGQYGQALGVIDAIEAIRLHQKTVDYSPQTKVLEFLVAVMGGFEYLKDISLSAHPLDQDAVVARAWRQPGWADHSGVSRTLSQLSEAEVQAIEAALDQISQPLIDREVMLAAGSGRIVLDGDLSPRRVSNTSQTYPDAAFGHMSDQVGLGYQAALVSMESPTYRRLLLSVDQHPGSTVSSTQAEALVLAAEKRMKRKPLRRVDLLEQRIDERWAAYQQQKQRVNEAEQNLLQGQQAWRSIDQQLQAAQRTLEVLAQAYQEQQRIERPHSHLAKARKQVSLYQRRLGRNEQEQQEARAWLGRQHNRLAEQIAVLTDLMQRLKRFQAENAANQAPIQAVLRLDAGFGTQANVSLLIEMGYELYTRPYGTWLSGELHQRIQSGVNWQRVGSNAEMVTWPGVQLPDCPYPLDLARERFWLGEGRYRHAALLHFGQDPVAQDPGTWFRFYNARQTIEAANKEGKQVFEIRHLKVRTRPALKLQEIFTLFAANFIRFASLWLTEQCPQVPDGWQQADQPKIKQQVKVGAQSAAWVSWLDQEVLLLRFEEHSLFAGRSLTVKPVLAFQPVLPFAKNCFFPSI